MLQMQLVEFSGEARFQIFYTKMDIRKHYIVCQFQTEIINVKWFQTEQYSIQTLITYQ